MAFNALTWREPFAQVGTIGSFEGIAKRAGTLEENLVAVIQTSILTPTLVLVPLKTEAEARQLETSIRRKDIVVVGYTPAGLVISKAYPLAPQIPVVEPEPAHDPA